MGRVSTSVKAEHDQGGNEGARRAQLRICPPHVTAQSHLSRYELHELS
jgi:hypothetical protein